MRGLLADADCEGQFDRLISVLRNGELSEVWDALGLAVLKFFHVGLDAAASDREVWHVCQTEQLWLVTANRNADNDDALQCVIAECNAPHCLPVVTLANAQRVVDDRRYAERTAERLLDYLIDADNYVGTGRPFVP